MSSSSEKVTIGVPVYRGEQFVEETLHTILGQTYSNYEVVISIDGPDPACEGICQPFLKDPRFRMVVQPQRLGWVGNFNWLLTQVTGDFWYYHQQDDLTAPEYIEALLDHARRDRRAALVYCDLVPMGRIEEPMVQPAPVLGATAFMRMMTLLHEHYPAFAFRGLTRAAAVREAGPAPENDADNFGVDICWLAGVARQGELHHVPRGLYRKRYHHGNTESKWWAWPTEKRFKPWVAHCLNMLEAALRIKQASVPEHRMLWLAAIERLTSLGAAAHFLPVKKLSVAERQMLFETFLERAQTSSAVNIPRLLDASWDQIRDWSRGFYWLPSGEPFVIEAFGPKPVHSGVPFNQQPNGNSAIWVRLARPAEPGLQLQLDGHALNTIVAGSLLTAGVPPAVTESPGDKPLLVLGPSNEPRSEAVQFRVLPPL